MFYTDIRDKDYETYRSRPLWPWHRRRAETFDRIHRQLMIEIGKKSSPALFVSVADSPNTKADFFDVIIDAVLDALEITGPQKILLRAVIKIVLQILLASLVMARPAYGSTGDYDSQVKRWASEALAL